MTDDTDPTHARKLSPEARAWAKRWGCAIMDPASEQERGALIALQVAVRNFRQELGRLGLALGSVGVHDGGRMLGIVDHAEQQAVTVTATGSDTQVALRVEGVLVRNFAEAADELEYWRHWAELYDMEAVTRPRFPARCDNERRSRVNRYIAAVSSDEGGEP